MNTLKYTVLFKPTPQHAWHLNPLRSPETDPGIVRLHIKDLQAEGVAEIKVEATTVTDVTTDFIP